MTGKIVLIERGVCNFSEKVFNAQRGGAIAAFVYNSAADGDDLATMGAGRPRRRRDDPVVVPPPHGRAEHGRVRERPPGHRAGEVRLLAAPVGEPGRRDGRASARVGPTQDKLLKPDVVAPGVDVVSSGYAVGDFPIPFTGFGSASGTSMAGPHVAGSAALLLQLHPNWTPAQIKSALMTTATENVWTNTTRTSARACSPAAPAAST